MNLITHTLPWKARLTAAQVEPVMGGAGGQSWWLIDQQRPADVDWKPLVEAASYPQSLVEEKWLPVTSRE